MIPVVPVGEPDDFDGKVRVPGREDLDANPHKRDLATASETLLPKWREALENLSRAYGHRCAYTTVFIEPLAARWGTIDHFLPVKDWRDEAYEWDNLRLSAGWVNSRKGDRYGVLDPFDIRDGWFELDPATMEIRAGAAAEGVHRTFVEETARRLLNGPDAVRRRTELVDGVIAGRIHPAVLQHTCPFLYAEAARLGLI